MAVWIKRNIESRLFSYDQMWIKNTIAQCKTSFVNNMKKLWLLMLWKKKSWTKTWHLVDAKETECHNVSTPRSSTGTAAWTAGNVSPVKHQSDVVGTLRVAAVTSCSQHSCVAMRHWLRRQHWSTEMKAFMHHTHHHVTQLLGNGHSNRN